MIFSSCSFLRIALRQHSLARKQGAINFKLLTPLNFKLPPSVSSAPVNQQLVSVLSFSLNINISRSRRLRSFTCTSRWIVRTLHMAVRTVPHHSQQKCADSLSFSVSLSVRTATCVLHCVVVVVVVVVVVDGRRNRVPIEFFRREEFSSRTALCDRVRATIKRRKRGARLGALI